MTVVRDVAPSAYVARSPRRELPRLPHKASLDLTYRCNNACRHCWLWRAGDAAEQARELTTAGWRAVIDQSRALGVREWALSGGEPLLREDFAELFEYATGRAAAYSLNTNGTLITPAVAQLLRRPGAKMISVYGARAATYERVTGNPDGFAALVQGLSYLKEAGAGFVVQLVPMRDNWHEWEHMLAFAQSWSAQYRVGAAWLYKTACGHDWADAEIERQRLAPADVLRLDAPDVPYSEGRAAQGADGGCGAAQGEDDGCGAAPADDRLYAACIARRREFHVDAYGGLSFCSFVKDPALRYDLRAAGAGADEGVNGRVADVGAAADGGLNRRAAGAGAGEGVDGRDAYVCAADATGIPVGAAAAPGIPAVAVETAWERFIPSLAGVVRGGREYCEGCGACELRADCRWCDVYGYLEHGRHGAKVDYLCEVARATRNYKQRWVREHRRFFAIAGMTIQVDSDLPFGPATMGPRFASFRADGPGPDTIFLRHHFGLPERDGAEGAEEIYRRPPWAISRRGGSWIYRGIATRPDDPALHRVAVFTDDHSRATIYNDPAREQTWRDGGLTSLSLFPTDQIVLARLVADRDAIFLHSAAVALNGQGLVFAGHSEAGKSTTMLLLKEALGERVSILCDDRNIVREWPRGFAGGPPGFYVHGTWSHGDVPEVSSAGVPLRAVLFLEQSPVNELVALGDRKAIYLGLLATLIKPLVTADWYDKELDVLERLAAQADCYRMRFDRSGGIVPAIERLVQ